MSSPRFGILAWEKGKVSRGLLQLESLKGNSTNLDTYDFPVRIERVPGACRKTVVTEPDPGVLDRMIEIARRMESEGVRCITTSCGFNAIFQREVSRSIRIPFFSSSLLQIPFLRAMFGPDRPIMVLTASKKSLKPEHFEATGTTDLDHLPVYGMREDCEQWGRMKDFDAEIDLDLLTRQFLEIALRAFKENPSAAAFLFECTDMPPFSEDVRKATGLPVFDFVTMAQYVYRSIVQNQY